MRRNPPQPDREPAPARRPRGRGQASY